MSEIKEQSQKLLSRIYTTKDLKHISLVLESLAGNQQFKQRAYEIATDDHLSDNQKANQLMLLLKRVQIPEIYEFFHGMFSQYQFWMFDSREFDRFDDFVKSFQLEADTLAIVHLSTAIELSDEDLRNIGKYFTQVLEKHAILSHHVNPEILAGAQVRIENYIYDYSLRAKFQRFQQKWIDSLTKTSQLLQT